MSFTGGAARLFLVLAILMLAAFFIAISWARHTVVDLQEEQCRHRAEADARIEGAYGNKSELEREGQDRCAVHEGDGAVKPKAHA